MDILGALEVVAVMPISDGGEFLLDKANRDIEIDIEIRPRKVEFPEFGIEDPLSELFHLIGIGQLCALVGDIGIDIPVQKDRSPIIEGLFQLRGRPVTVFGKEEGDQLGMDPVVAAEISAKEP